jgi:hypothetical protein
MVCNLRGRGKTVNLVWVKGHEGTPGNEKANALAGRAAEKPGYSRVMSIAHLKLVLAGTWRQPDSMLGEVPARAAYECS